MYTVHIQRLIYTWKHIFILLSITKNIQIHKKAISVQLNLLLVVFCLHVLFIINFSIKLLSLLPRRLFCYNIMLNIYSYSNCNYANLWHTLPL